MPRRWNTRARRVPRVAPAVRGFGAAVAGAIAVVFAFTMAASAAPALAAEAVPRDIAAFLVARAASHARAGEPECTSFDPALGLPFGLQCSVRYRGGADITVAVVQPLGVRAGRCERACGDPAPGAAVVRSRRLVLAGVAVWLYFAPNDEGEGLASAAASGRYDIDITMPGVRSDAELEVFVRALPWAVLPGS